MFKMMISFVLVLGMMALYRVKLSVTMLYFFPLLIILLIVTFGISMLLMHFGVFVEDLSNVINVLLRLLFYMSGVFYSITKRVPGTLKTVLLNVNPVALIMEDLRRCVLYGEQPHIISLAIWLVIGILLSIVGVRTVYKYENSYVKVI